MIDSFGSIAKAATKGACGGDPYHVRQVSSGGIVVELHGSANSHSESSEE